MDAQDKSNTNLLKTVVNDPEHTDEAHIEELQTRIANVDSNFDRAATKVLATPKQSTLLVWIWIILRAFYIVWIVNLIWKALLWILTPIWTWVFRPAIIWILNKLGFPTWSWTSWSNYVDQQTCYPIDIRRPKNLSQIVKWVQEANSKKITIRAVGSGHSYSDVAPVYKGGILLDPHGMNRVLSIDKTILNDAQLASGIKLFAVESGITIKELNSTLDKKGLALKNMGAYDGQTLAGAISTGTHGTGIDFGPIASIVRAVVLVSGDGTVYHIEPSLGISDPDKFQKTVGDRTLMQNDDWFRTVVVSMGCTGIIYSYVLEVVDAFYLKEERTLTTWDTAKQDLKFEIGQIPKVLRDNRHYEVDINPYLIGGSHTCVIQRKNIEHTNHSSGSRGVANWISGLLASWPLAEYWTVRLLNHVPSISPWIINQALHTLVGEKKPYIDKSYKVLNLGAVNNVKAVAMELSYPADDQLVTRIDELLGIFQNEADKMGWYMAGPFSLRFVAAAEAHLAPQQGRLTCMVELDMLLGMNTGNELLKTITKRVQDKDTTPPVRVHWGLDLDTATRQSVEKRYSEFSQWNEVYKQLNSTGVFNSPFTDRLQISVGTSENLV